MSGGFHDREEMRQLTFRVRAPRGHDGEDGDVARRAPDRPHHGRVRRVGRSQHGLPGRVLAKVPTGDGTDERGGRRRTGAAAAGSTAAGAAAGRDSRGRRGGRRCGLRGRRRHRRRHGHLRYARGQAHNRTPRRETETPADRHGRSPVGGRIPGRGYQTPRPEAGASGGVAARTRRLVREVAGHAVGAEAVAELRLRMRAHVQFHLRPGAVLVAHSFAPRAGGQKPFQDLDLRERLFHAPREFLLASPQAAFPDLEEHERRRDDDPERAERRHTLEPGALVEPRRRRDVERDRMCPSHRSP